MPALDLAVLAELSQLAIDSGRADLLETLIRGFVEEEYPPAVAELSESLGAGDAERFARVTHKLRGASATLGAAGLARLLTDFESRALTGQLGSPAEMLGQLNTEMKRLRAELALYQSASHAPPPRP